MVVACNAEAMRASLRAYFPRDQWVLGFEVGDSTGVALRRWADCVAMNLWPSRGLEIQGIEIKVSRSDLLREIENPAKAETLAAYCDSWWLAVPRGLIRDTDPIPDGWGILERGADPEEGEARKTAFLRIKRQAARKPPEERVATIPRRFMAALGRAIQKEDEAAVEARARERAAEIVAGRDLAERRDAERVRIGNASVAERIAEVLPRDAAWDAENFVRAAAVVAKSSVAHPYSGAASLLTVIDQAASVIDGIAARLREALDDAGIPEEERRRARATLDVFLPARRQ